MFCGLGRPWYEMAEHQSILSGYSCTISLSLCGFQVKNWKHFLDGVESVLFLLLALLFPFSVQCEHMTGNSEKQPMYFIVNPAL